MESSILATEIPKQIWVKLYHPREKVVIVPLADSL
ncbi:MAG: hypothetical protein KatS3mg091_406 [Patescibacteria group bacterium]|nr:MAG: hypothetical protein KatS3mg091_406 [Patescibacteria group bacterium]